MRALYVEFAPRQDLGTLLRCHLHGFEGFGGVPQRILFDNMTTVAEERDGERMVFPPRFLDFALLAVVLSPSLGGCWLGGQLATACD